ncbi:MAG: hypothetical protein A3E40_03600 [Candidatus Levybacteria bacterium RIFCSPHIGHO2_12_FULL_37_9]|nr:MAG: hypothetical protein A3E40_03600 [Candidatus Levybacteria bacterium RIFCSPHIGHO2_12_FULL_37_9]
MANRPRLLQAPHWERSSGIGNLYTLGFRRLKRYRAIVRKRRSDIWNKQIYHICQEKYQEKCHKSILEESHNHLNYFI